MGGTNPYIEKTEVELPTKPYTITYRLPDKTTRQVQVDPDKIPYGPTGLPGSVLNIALGNGIDLEHACGGVCACSTCHVIVKEGLESCNEGTDDEFDQLEEAQKKGDYVAVTARLPVCAERDHGSRRRDSCCQQKPRQGRPLILVKRET